MPRIAILYDALPFQSFKGVSQLAGRRLARKAMLCAGFNNADLSEFTILPMRPPYTLDVQAVLAKKVSAMSGQSMIVKGGYYPYKWKDHYTKLRAKLQDYDGAIAMGAVGAWFLTGKPNNLSACRGTLLHPHDQNKTIGIVTFSAESAHRAGKQLHYIYHDMLKLKRGLERGSLGHTVRTVYVAEIFPDLIEFENKFLNNDMPLACDIETVPDAGIIKEISFAVDEHTSLVVPLWKDGESLWPSGDLLRVLNWIRKIINSGRKIVGHNFSYDIAFMLNAWGMPVTNASEDTMLMFSALQPELLKGLGSIGATYTDSPYWKHLGKDNKDDGKD